MSELNEYRERSKLLYEAAAFIESIPDEQFNMNHWWLSDGMAFDDERNRMHKVADGPCGCAAGHMMQRGLFGLSTPTERVERQRMFVILGDAFGVGWKRAEFMFDQYAYDARDRQNKQVVATRIRFIADEALQKV